MVQGVLHFDNITGYHREILSWQAIQQYGMVLFFYE